MSSRTIPSRTGPIAPLLSYCPHQSLKAELLLVMHEWSNVELTDDKERGRDARIERVT